MTKSNYSIIGVFLVALLAGELSAADWGQWRGPRRDGVDHECPPLLAKLPETGLKPVWFNKELPGAGGGGWSSPIVAQGKVFLYSHVRAKDAEKDLPPQKYPSLSDKQKAEMSEDDVKEYERVRGEEEAERRRLLCYEDRVHCLDAESGELLWTSNSPSKYTQFPQSGSPAVVGNRLYLLGGGRIARCLDTKNGQELWHTRLPGEFKEECQHSSFAVADGVAAVLAGKLFALDAASGKMLWEGDDTPAGDLHSSPVVWEHAGKSWFIAAVSGRDVVCVEPRTGEEAWRIAANVSQATPLVVGDRLITYGPSRKNGLRCFSISPEDAEPEWGYSGISDPGSSPVVLDGRVFVQGEKRLACLDLETGEPVWTADLNLHDPRYTSLVAGDGKVFYALDGVLAFPTDADEFAPLWRGKLDRTGLLVEEQTFRKELDADQLESTAEGQKKFEKLWRERFSGGGPVTCTSPALAGGRLYVRTNSGVACLDLRRK